MPSDRFRSLAFAFWATKITKKSLIVWQRWRSTIARGAVTRLLLFFSYYRGNQGGGEGRNSCDFPRNPGQALSYFNCGKQGHFKRSCNSKKRDLAMQEKNGASQSSTE